MAGPTERNVWKEYLSAMFLFITIYLEKYMSVYLAINGIETTLFSMKTKEE